MEKFSLFLIALIIIATVIVIGSAPSAAELQKKKIEALIQQCVDDGHPEWYCYSELKDCK